MLNANSTTEEDTEEEVPSTPSNKKTKRRRRNFSSSTSSSYSSSLATNSTIHSSSVTPATSKKSSAESQSTSSTVKDLIAYRTRSRTQSVERSVDIDSSGKSLSGQKRKTSRASRSQLLSDSEIEEDDSQEEQADNGKSTVADKNSSNKKTVAKPVRSVRGAGGSGSKKISETKSNNKPSATDNSSVNSENNQSQSTSRNLRSRSALTSSATTAIPNKRQRVGEQSHQASVSAGGSTNPESTGSGSKAPNLGARLSRNQGGREAQYTSAQQQPDTSSTQQQTGHPPQNLLRRSSRSKGASSSSTTGSCVSFTFFAFLPRGFNRFYLCRFHHQLPLTLSPLVQQ